MLQQALSVLSSVWDFLADQAGKMWIVYTTVPVFMIFLGLFIVKGVVNLVRILKG